MNISHTDEVQLAISLVIAAALPAILHALSVSIQRHTHVETINHQMQNIPASSNCVRPTHQLYIHAATASISLEKLFHVNIHIPLDSICNPLRVVTKPTLIVTMHIGVVWN